MASFTIYDPKTRVFRAIETADSIDLPFDQVLFINILIELRVISELLVAQKEETDATGDDADELRTAMVQETGNQ